MVSFVSIDTYPTLENCVDVWEFEQQMEVFPAMDEDYILTQDLELR